MAANLDLDVPVEQLRGAETLPRAKQQRMLAEAAGEPKEEEEKQREVFYTEGADELKQARVWLCRFTMERAAARLAAERAKVEAQANDAAGHEADSLAFSAYTGVGDGIAVAAGHTSYYAAKKAIVDPNINIGEQAGLGVWLGSAAVCSGALWQPLVNALQASEKLPFNAVMGATMVGCGGAFLTGLRVGRFVFPWMPGCDNGNFSTDAYLSMAIGSA